MYLSFFETFLSSSYSEILHMGDRVWDVRGQLIHYLRMILYDSYVKCQHSYLHRKYYWLFLQELIYRV